MTTQFNPTALAARLGVTREDFPEWFGRHCTACDRRWGVSVNSCPRCHERKFIVDRCTLPDPRDPDDSRTQCWIPFLIRALCDDAEPVMDEYFQVLRSWPELIKEKPLTAALYAAYDAKEAK
jgi:hypothetical protein